MHRSPTRTCRIWEKKRLYGRVIWAREYRDLAIRLVSGAGVHLVFRGRSGENNSQRANDTRNPGGYAERCYLTCPCPLRRRT